MGRSSRDVMRAWRRTPKGVVQQIWSHMVSHTSDPQDNLFGMEIPDKDVFYEWALTHGDFKELMDKWQDSGYKKGENPAITRICKSIGFVVTNLEWVTYRERQSWATR